MSRTAWDRLTDIHQPKVRDIARLRDKLVDRIFYAGRLVQLAGNGRERTVGSFVRSAASHVDADSEPEGFTSELRRLVGLGGLSALDLELARSPRGRLGRKME